MTASLDCARIRNSLATFKGRASLILVDAPALNADGHGHAVEDARAIFDASEELERMCEEAERAEREREATS